MSEVSSTAAGPADGADDKAIGWPGVEIVTEARAGVTANLAILAEHSAAVRVALANLPA